MRALLCFVYLFLAGCSGTSSPEKPEDPRATPKETAPPEAAVTAPAALAGTLQEILSRREANPIAFDEDYLGKVLRIRLGAIAVIDRRAVVLSAVWPPSEPYAYCHLSDPAAHRKLKVQRSITVEGRFSEVVKTGIVLRGCKIIP